MLARLEPSSILLILCAAVVVYLVMVPMFMLVWSSLKTTPVGVPGPLTLANFVKSWTDPAGLQLMANSFTYAIGICAVAFIFSFPLAWLVERTNVPGRNFAYTLVYVGFFIPGMLAGIAYIMLLSSKIGLINTVLMNVFGLSSAPFDAFTLYAMIFVGGVQAADMMFLLLSASMRSMDPSQEEAAATSGASTFRTMRTITLPMMFPAILASAIYILIRGIESFEIPAVLGIPAGILVFASKIYLASSSIPVDYGTASSLGVGMLVICALGILLYQQATKKAEKYVTVSGKAYRPRRIDLGRWKYLGTAYIYTYLAFSVAMPILILFWASLLPYYQSPSPEALSLVTLKAYQRVLSLPGVQQAAMNTLFLAVVVGAFTVFLAAVISWIVVRSKIAGRKVLDFLAFSPLAMPGIVIGLALLFAYLVIPIPVYGTIWILAIVLVTQCLPWTTRNTNNAFLQIHHELEDASRISGASWWRTFRTVLIPLVIPAVVAGLLWVFVRVVKDLSAVILLYSPKNQVISITVFELWQTGRVADVGALSMMMVAGIGVVTFLARRWMEAAARRGDAF